MSLTLEMALLLTCSFSSETTESEVSQLLAYAKMNTLTYADEMVIGSLIALRRECADMTRKLCLIKWQNRILPNI